MDVFLGASPLIGKPYRHFNYNGDTDVDNVMTEIKESTATLITQGYKWCAPEWIEILYESISWIIGVLSGIGTWIGCIVVGNVWGFLFGWIPAIIVALIMGAFWLPIIGFILWYLYL